VGKAGTRWEDIVLSDTSQITETREWRRRAGDREELRRLLGGGQVPEGAVAT